MDNNSKSATSKIERVRLGNLSAVRKTRSRFLRLLLAEDEKDVDTVYWRMVFSQLDSLRADLLAEADLKIEARLQALEELVQSIRAGRSMKIVETK